MAEDDKEEEQNKEDEEKQNSKKPTLKDTRGFYYENHYADKLDTGHNSENDSSACFYCLKCKKSFHSKIEFDFHKCK